MVSNLTTPPTLVKPFANEGDKNTIPTDATGTQAASLEEGFPAITATPINEGGIPPEREDFNGLGYLTTSQYFYLQMGGKFTFNPAVSAAIGGYPEKAVLQYTDPNTGQSYEVTSLIPNNTYNFVTNPEYIDGLKWRKSFSEDLRSYVTTNTAQTIMADKSFSGSLYKDNPNLDINTNPTSQMNNQIWFRDKNGIGYAVIQANQLANGTVSFSLMAKARSSNSYSSIGVIQAANGSTSTVAPTPASSDNSTKIATTAFVKSSSSGYSTYKSGATISSNTNYTVPSNGVIAGEISAAQNGWVQVGIDSVIVEQVGSEPSQRCRAPFYAIVKKGQVVKLATSGNAAVPLAKFYAFS